MDLRVSFLGTESHLILTANQLRTAHWPGAIHSLMPFFFSFVEYCGLMTKRSYGIIGCQRALIVTNCSACLGSNREIALWGIHLFLV